MADLAAMGAICDVTPLVRFNRALTAQGLKVMSGWKNPGLKALLEVAKASGPATTFHAGFILGPRINAGGRIGRLRHGDDVAAQGGAAAGDVDLGLRANHLGCCVSVGCVHRRQQWVDRRVASGLAG